MWHVADWGAVPVHEQAQRHAALVRQHRGTYIVLVVDDDDDDGICTVLTIHACLDSSIWYVPHHSARRCRAKFRCALDIYIRRGSCTYSSGILPVL